MADPTPAAPKAAISSPSNPRLKAIVALRRRRDRERAGTWLVEGYEELSMALDSGVRPLSLYWCPELVADRRQFGLLAAVEATGAEVVQLGERAFRRAAYREAPDGWLALVPAVATGLEHLRLPADPLLLVCESVEKPGNLGAMLRTADAAGLDAVVAAHTVAGDADAVVRVRVEGIEELERAIERLLHGRGRVERIGDRADDLQFAPGGTGGHSCTS
jgi:TrmH family RNA methyltransferase